MMPMKAKTSSTRDNSSPDVASTVLRAARSRRRSRRVGRLGRGASSGGGGSESIAPVFCPVPIHWSTPNVLERRLPQRLDSLVPAPRAKLLHVLMLPDLERAGRERSGQSVERSLQERWRSRNRGG
jgi:hypothetical protein